MFPYLEIPLLRLGPLAFSTFRVLLALAVLTGYFTMIRRARRARLDSGRAAALCVWVLVPGFLMAHWFKLFYLRGPLDPRDFLRILNGISSFGGIAGGLAGAAIFFWRQRMPAPVRRRYLDVLAYSFLCGLAVGRIGCFLAHDHPGIRTTSWLAVQYPGGARYDLALLEFIAILGLVMAFRLQWPAGSYTAAVLVLYAIFRLSLDALHEDPPRYWGISVDQFASAGCLVVGLTMLRCGRGRITAPSDQQHTENVPRPPGK